MFLTFIPNIWYSLSRNVGIKNTSGGVFPDITFCRTFAVRILQFVKVTENNNLIKVIIR